MKTIDDIVYFCNELNPVGALMITGKWGSGKTYLIEHDIKKELEKSHIIVRVSLFGLSSIKELDENVKARWIDECAPWFKANNDDSLVNIGTNIIKVIGTAIPKTKKIVDTALSINPIDFIQIKNKVGKNDKKKSVVLVFDDLERSRLNTIDLLGSINNYCENLRFHVIALANEDKLPIRNKEKHVLEKEDVSNDNKKPDDTCESNSTTESRTISYSEIKEKVVCRTIKYIPDYSRIIKSVIESQDNGLSCEYIGFLKNNEDKIIELFENDIPDLDENEHLTDYSDKRPKNIRLLKCALHDFERVYRVYKDESISDKVIYNHLIVFIAYTLAYKSGLLSKSDKHHLISNDNTFSRIYPWLNQRVLLNTEIDWITTINNLRIQYKAMV